MNTKGAQLWYVGAGLIAAVVLVAGWFLLVSPAKTNAADITAQTASVEQANMMTQQKINQLKEQSKDLPAQEQQIAAVRTKIPESAEMPSLIRALSDQAKASGVTLQSLTPATASPNGALSTIPVALVVTGDFANVRLFVNSLETMKRAYFVGGLDIKTVDTGGSTSSADGPLTATITGNVFMSTSFEAPAPAAGTTTDTAAVDTAAAAN